jgi:DNA invertase Pin-like site-specific DNA recombinase
VLGYATLALSAHRRHRSELREQAEVIAAACSRSGLVFLELVREREPASDRGLERPGLGYALDRISAGEATGLVVADIAHLSASISGLGAVLRWFSGSNARLLAVAQGLDTADADGWLAVETLIELSLLEAQPTG